MKLTVKPENILEAIALQTRKKLSPSLLAMLGMGVSQASCNDSLAIGSF